MSQIRIAFFTLQSEKKTVLTPRGHTLSEAMYVSCLLATEHDWDYVQLTYIDRNPPAVGAVRDFAVISPARILGVPD